jgi:hypothetical protein
MKTILLIVAISSLFSACGANPTKVAKERDRADEQRKEVQQENTELQADARLLKTSLKNVVSTSNSIWTVAETTAFHQVALQVCEDLGFSLPTAAEIEEFKTEIYDSSTKWQQIPFKRFFQADVVEDQSSDFGFVLCRRDHLVDIFQQ